MRFKRLHPGEPAPWLRVRSLTNPRYRFDTVAGRYVVLCFFGSATHREAKASIAAVLRRRDLFNDEIASFFGVTSDYSDVQESRIADSYPGYRYFIDTDFEMARAFGAADIEGTRHEVVMRWVVLDPLLRVLSVIPFSRKRSDITELFTLLEGLPPLDQYPLPGVHAPVLVLPNVFEPEFCQKLIGLYDAHGGEESGFMREVDGKTVVQLNPDHKRRKDYLITDPEIIAATQLRMKNRIIPEIRKAYQYEATRMERYIVGCYAAEDNAHFGPHRDNTTSGTAHRRFAVSINLNEDFEGGEVSFPEFGPRRFRPPPGGAVVFSCSLLHQVSTVTSGRRYAFLPFLYDEAAARIREANNDKLGEGVLPYQLKTG